MQRLAVILLMAGLAGAAGAEGRGEGPPSPLTGAVALLEILPKDLLKDIRRGPERFLDQTTLLISGYGSASGIDAAGIARYIAVERAEARARQLSAILIADLDNDGEVSMAEVGSLSTVISARQRGFLVRGFPLADTSHDGRLDTGELRASAQAAAKRRVSDQDALMLSALMLLDLNGNSLVSNDEVALVVLAAQEAEAEMAAKKSDL